MKKKVLVNKLLLPWDGTGSRYPDRYVYDFVGGARVTLDDFIQWQADTGFKIDEEPRSNKNGVVLTFSDEYEYKLFMIKHGGGR